MQEQGIYNPLQYSETSSRSGVMFGVDSVGDLFSSLSRDGVKIFQENPIEMQEGVFWIQFSDPSGNIIEVLGGK